MTRLRRLIHRDMKIIMKTYAHNRSILFDEVLHDKEVIHLEEIMGTHEEATVELQANNMLGKKPQALLDRLLK